MSLHCDHCGAEVDATVRFDQDDDRGIWLCCTNPQCDKSGRFGGDDIRVVDRGRGIATDGGAEVTDATSQFTAKMPASQFAEWLDQLATLVEEARLEFTENGIRSEMDDPANVGLVTTKLPAAAFEEFEADPYEIGLRIEDTLDLLDNYDPNSSVEMSLSEDRGWVVFDDGSMQFEQAVIDAGSVRNPDNGPLTSVDASVVTGSQEVLSLVDAADSVSHTVRIGIDGETIRAKADGDIHSAKMEIRGQPAEEGQTFGNLYALDYLTDFKPAIEHADEVEVGVGSDYPLMLSYVLPDSDGEVYLNLAPRIKAGGDDDGW